MYAQGNTHSFLTKIVTQTKLQLPALERDGKRREKGGRGREAHTVSRL